jgi:DNA repair ATPase RecN
MPLKVRVRNFQSIEDEEIIIERLTVLTGTNNAGKSAFFRAIRGAFTNARGSDFVRNGTKHCIVDIEDTETGDKLTWKKGSDGTNDYVINGTHYPKVGHGAPPEARIFGVEPVTVSNAELWPQIAPQITGVSFLLDQPGSIIAEAVADVDRVNQLGRALKDCESERRAVRGELKTRRKDAETLAERREGFSGLDAVLKTLKGIETRHDKCEKMNRARANMVKLGDRYKQAWGAVAALDGIEDAGRHLPTQERVQEARERVTGLVEARRLRERRSTAKTLVDGLAGLGEVEDSLPSEPRAEYAQQFRKAIGLTVDLAMRFEEARRELDRAQAAEAALAILRLESKAPEQAARVRKALTSARGLRDRRAKALEDVGTLGQQLGTLREELERISVRASEMLGSFQECPTCGGGLDHVH